MDDTSSLFANLTTEFRKYLNEQQNHIKKGILVFPSSANDRISQSIFSNLVNGGYCTLVVTGRRDWDPSSYYYETVRNAARRGCKINRSFLLPHRHLRHDPNLQQHIKLDNDANIQTRILYVGDLVAREVLSVAGSLEFGIWDNVVGCVGVPMQNGISEGIEEWHITDSEEELQLLRDIKRVLEEQSSDITVSEKHNSFDLEEPMITTAPIAHELAGVLCQGDHVSPEDCSWYHAIWQYLRIFNMVSTPTWHAEFYRESIGRIANKAGDHHILISGTADYSMLAHVLWAYGDKLAKANVTVLDLCETPLFLCKWYGKNKGEQVKTFAMDILQFQPDRLFDLITTDAFLTRFLPKQRIQVLQKWHQLLSNDGYVVTTVRVEPGCSFPVRATPSDIKAFRSRVLRAAKKWRDFIRYSPDQLATLAETYAQNMTSYSIGSQKEVEELFVNAGFKIERCDMATVPGEMASTQYAEVAARKI